MSGGNTYKALTRAAEAAFQLGEFEHEFTPTEEAEWVGPGLIEIVPRRYRVLVDTEVFGVKGTDADPTFEAAMLIEPEAALLSGGHIERMRMVKKTDEVPTKPTSDKQKGTN